MKRTLLSKTTKSFSFFNPKSKIIYLNFQQRKKIMENIKFVLAEILSPQQINAEKKQKKENKK